MSTEYITLAAAVAAIIWVNWYFLYSPRGAVAAATVSGSEVNIVIEGGYTPRTVQRVQAGKPVRLIFDRRENSPCSEEVVLSDFGIRQFLPPFQKTAIELTPRKAGSYEFTCGMNMLRGRIEVVETA